MKIKATVVGHLQGSPEWHAHRARSFNASELAAAMGISKYMTRAQLLAQKATGIIPEVDAETQRRFDKGHEYEAAARSLAEAHVNEDLYPCVLAADVDGLPLSASLDGMDLMQELTWEHKSASATLIASLEADVIPDEYHPQMEQGLMLTGAKKCLFSASNGTPESMRSVWYESNPELRAKIIPTWKQFASDLAAYVPPQVTPQVVATPVESLPAVLVRMSGALTIESNLDAFGKALHAFIDKIPEKPTTDQQFADTDAACKALKKAEEALKAEEDRALAGMADVEQMRRIVADLRDLARKTRLAREKMVEARKTEIRLEEIQRGKTVIAAHIAGLNDALGKPYMPASKVDFALAIKGLRSLDSVRAAIDQAIADAKIEASATQQRIMANLKRLQDAGHPMLFADMASLVLKDADDLSAIIASRVAQHEFAEAKRLEAERERIRAEEQRRAAELAEKERERIRIEEQEKARREAAEAQRVEAARVAAEQAKARLEAEAARKLENELIQEMAERKAKEEAELARIRAWDEEAAEAKKARDRCARDEQLAAVQAEEATLTLWPERGWQPIATAPRTGLIDLWADRRHTDCYWDHVCSEYRRINSSGFLIRIRTATHWMPVPKPPEGTT